MIVYNPAESVTKAASFAIAYGAGSKVPDREDTPPSSPSIWSSTIVPVPSAVKAKCTKVADEWLARQRSSPLMAQRESQCLKKHLLLCEESRAINQQLTVISDQIKEQCRNEFKRPCKRIVEKELLADKEEARESCEMREVAEIEKVECRRQQLSQSRPSQEVESYCSIIAVRTEQRHRAGAATRRSASWMIEALKAASQAYTINVQAALHGANHVVDQKIETQLTIGQKTPVTSIMEGLVKMNIAFKLPNQPKPFAVDVESNYLVRRPANAWDLKDMMVEDLTSKVNTKVEMGLMDGEKEVIAVDMIAKRTEELKQIVSLTEDFKQCEQMITKGEKLSLVCKKARSLAAILDLLEMNVALPKTIVNNNYVRTLLDVVKASLLPYLSVEPSTYNLRTESHELAKIQMRTDSMGKLVTLVVDANEQKTIAKNLRYSLPLPLPIQVRESAIVHAIERVTQYGLPTTCAIENNKVRTFDKMVYDYALNNCE